jgi:hypothetical protein
VAFAGAYLATVKKPAPIPVIETRVFMVAIEQHSTNEHLRGAREILDVGTRHPALAALGPLQPAANSRYAKVLEHAA